MFLLQLFKYFDLSVKIKKMVEGPINLQFKLTAYFKGTQSVIVTFVRSAIANTHSSTESFSVDVYVEGKGEKPS